MTIRRAYVDGEAENEIFLIKKFNEKKISYLGNFENII